MYQINIGEIINDSLVIELDSGTKVLFPLEGDKQILLGALRLIDSKVTTEGEELSGVDGQVVETIDLRYKNPVLR